jgi:putative endonuclease
MKEYKFFVYILFNERAKATYIGVTNNLERRILEHKRGAVPGFSDDKQTHKLGYYEFYQYIDKAIAREKAIKKWNRAWKYRLIETMNPNWVDLAADVDWMLDPDRLAEDFWKNLELKKKGKEALFPPARE